MFQVFHVHSGQTKTYVQLHIYRYKHTLSFRFQVWRVDIPQNPNICATTYIHKYILYVLGFRFVLYILYVLCFRFVMQIFHKNPNICATTYIHKYINQTGQAPLLTDPPPTSFTVSCLQNSPGYTGSVNNIYICFSFQGCPVQ